MPQGRSRRELVRLLGGVVVSEPLWASDREFWDTKDPTQWSVAEIQRLLSDSPWATQVSVRLGKPDPAHDPRPWTGAPPISPRTPPLILPPLPHPTSFEALVRWESAKPILDAAKVPLPPTFLNCHVIGVSSAVLVVVLRSPPYRLDDLKTLATLETHGHNLVSAALIEAHPGSVPTLWFGFPKRLVRMGKNDSVVRFSTSFNGWKIDAKFNPRQMWYRGTESF